MKTVITVLCSIFCLTAAAQQDSLQPPYKRFPTLPPFRILLSDSTTYFTKAELPSKKAVFLMLFSPDCSHCQHETEELLSLQEQMKDIQVVMVTLHSLKDMKAFMQRYGLDAVPNIVVGKDVQFILPPFFGLHNLPFHALYNRKGDLIMAFEGSMSIEKVARIFRENR